jgi:hypothetical protein
MASAMIECRAGEGLVFPTLTEITGGQVAATIPDHALAALIHFGTLHPFRLVFASIQIAQFRVLLDRIFQATVREYRAR